jgi:hypothetical protein
MSLSFASLLLLLPTASTQAPVPSATPRAPVAGAPGAQAPDKAAPARAIDRVVCLGASLTEGFGLQPEIGAPVWLGDVFRAAVKPKTEAPQRLSSLLFFANPRGEGERSAKSARELDPTLVLAFDYLFWFGYGAFESPEKRKESLELGLSHLAGFRCPVLVGDLPDMSTALAGVPQMLQPQQIPAAAALAELNARIAEWAKTQPNVVLFPLGEHATKLRAGKELLLRGNIVFPSELPDLFQRDLLHPTAMGTIVVWIAGIDALVRARKDVPATWFEWDRQQIYRRLYALKEPERKAELVKHQKEYEKNHPAPPPPPPPDPSEIERKRRGERDGDG